MPLSRQQKDVLAAFITDLHATTFETPKFYVYVRFSELATGGDLYVAGNHRGNKVPNHIRATVRLGERTKETFDQVAMKINQKWDEVIADQALGAHALSHLPPKEKKLVQKLKIVAFLPLVAVLENGVAMPRVSAEPFAYCQR